MISAFLPGAGLGTRLRPLTGILPKPLVPVYGQPLAWYALKRVRDLGVRRVMINTHHLPGQWPIALKNHPLDGLDVSLSHEPVLLDTGGALTNIREWIGEDTLLVHNGDIYSELDLASLLELHARNVREHGHLATLLLRSGGELRNVAWNEASGQVTDMRGEIGAGDPLYQFTGIYVAEPGLVDLLPFGEVVSVVPAFLEAIRQGRVGGVVDDKGIWLDLGTPEIYRSAHQLIAPPADWVDGVAPDARVDETAEVRRSVVGPGAEVGAGSVVEDSVVWPGVVIPAGTRVREQVVTG